MRMHASISTYSCRVKRAELEFAAALQAGNNALTGSLPGGWNLPELELAAFFGCRLSGSLPSWQAPATAQVRVAPQEGPGFCGRVGGAMLAVLGFRYIHQLLHAPAMRMADCMGRAARQAGQAAPLFKRRVACRGQLISILQQQQSFG